MAAAFGVLNGMMNSTICDLLSLIVTGSGDVVGLGFCDAPKPRLLLWLPLLLMELKFIAERSLLCVCV